MNLSIRKRGSPWLLLLVGVAAALLAAMCLHYFCWQYVPSHAERLAEAGTTLPLSARLAMVISNWYLRLLPFLVISLVLLAPLVGLGAVVIAIVLARGGPRWLWQAFGIAFLCVAAAKALICGIMFYGIHAAYAALDG